MGRAGGKGPVPPMSRADAQDRDEDASWRLRVVAADDSTDYQ